MIKLPITSVKKWLENLNTKWFTWIAAVSVTVAVNLLVYNLTSLINKYKDNNTKQAIVVSKLIHSLDSINAQLEQSLSDVQTNVNINNKGFQHEFTSIKLQLLVQGKKIDILTGYITGYEDMIRNEFKDLDKTLKQFVTVNNDSSAIKYFKR